MKNNLTTICLLSLLITVLSFSSIYSADGKWDIKIELSKQDYVLHEPIWLDVTVTNNTSDTLRMQGLFPPNHVDFYVFLTDGNGKPVDYTGPQFGLSIGVGLLAQPGEQCYGSVNVAELFRSKELNSGYRVLDFMFPFIPKGTYTVRGYYQGDLSDELTFNIIEPSGQEEEVLRKIEQASKILSQEDSDPSSQLFGEIARGYPNSAFAENCYYLSRSFSQEISEGRKNGTYDPLTLEREMLSRYPNSGKVELWISAISRQMNEDEKIEYFSELIERYPNTRCSKVTSEAKRRLLAKREAGE